MHKFASLLLCTALVGCATAQISQKVYQPKDVESPSKPIIHITPIYPEQAEIDKVEGWVKMSAVINENGKVTNIRVLDAQPKGVFEDEAKRAFAKWLYKPALLDEQTVKVYQEATLRFNI